MAELKKEYYTRAEMDVIELHIIDVIMTSDPIEEEPEENGGGVIGDP